MQKQRRWLQECQEAYNTLLYITKNVEEDYILELFPIFKGMHIKTDFIYQWNNPYIQKDNVDKKLYLCIQFPSRNRKEIEEWFIDSKYTQFTLGEINFNTWMVELKVNDLITDLINNEIRTLHDECEELAQPFYENNENQLLSEYEEECLQDDEYYLGVRFIDYTGEYPNYCSNGILTLEIEGIPYEFKIQELQNSNIIEYNLSKIKPEAFDENIRRYYHEIMRILKKNLRTTCCGGCL